MSRLADRVARGKGRFPTSHGNLRNAAAFCAAWLPSNDSRCSPACAVCSLSPWCCRDKEGFMRAARLPSRVAFSSVHAGGQLRFLATNLDAHSSYLALTLCWGRTAKAPFPGGAQHYVRCALLTKPNQILEEGSSLPWHRSRYRRNCVALCRGWQALL